MKKTNKILIVAIFIFFILSIFVYKEYKEWKGEQYVPNRFKSIRYESPTHTPNGLFFENGYVWISSSHDQRLIKYDLAKGTVVESIEIPCFQAAGLAFDGENFWIADYGKRTIYKISATDSLLSPKGTVLGKYRTPYSTPYGLTWDGEHLWVLDVFGMEEYPTIGEGVYPDAVLYKYDPDTNTILERIESPVAFAGDITYKDGELIVTGCTSRKVFHVDISTGETTQWYYAPDTLPRTIATAEDNKYLLAGMQTRDLWELNLDKQAQYKDIKDENGAIVPFWIIIIFSLLLLPIFLDELMKRNYTEKKGFFEKLHFFLFSTDAAFILKFGIVTLLVYYGLDFISDYLFLRQISASFTTTFLGLLGVSTPFHIIDDFISVGGFIITRSCLSTIFSAIGIGFLLISHINFKKKILFSALIYSVIFAWNILRLSTLIVLTNYNVPYLLAHDLIFYIGGFTVVVLVLKFCSMVSPRMKKDFSFISMMVKNWMKSDHSHAM